MRTAATSWRVLPADHDEPERLLDRSLTLLDAMADDPAPTLRWYTPTRTGIVLGRGQRTLEVAEADGVRTVVRSSGGGAVLLDEGMLSLDVLLPAGHPWISPDLGELFVRVGSCWAVALERLGVPGLTVHDGPSTAPRGGAQRARLLASVCYATVGRGEVLAHGRKLVGLAQRRRRHGALVQCGLLLHWRPQRLLAALGADPADPEITGAAVGLDELVTDPPDPEEIATSVETALAEGEPATRRAS